MNISSLSNAAQEAMETPAQTRAEASHGDSQASRRLARINVPQVASQATPSVGSPATQSAPPAAPVDQAASIPPDSTGTILNVKA